MILGKLYPEFERVNKQNLEYAFSRVMKSIPLLNNSQDDCRVVQKPLKKSTGIAILEKALQAGKRGAAL